MVLREWLWDNATISFRCVLISNAVFWPISFLCLLADHLVATQPRRHPVLTRCKLQPQKHLSYRDRMDLLSLASFNMIFLAIFICCPIYEWLWNCIQSSTRAPRLTESDNWILHSELFVKIPVHAVLTEIAFYSTHYLLHSSPFLYRNIHKVHHRFQAPTAMTCVHAHPLEFAIGNIFPIWLGPILTNAHPFTCYIWFALAMMGTCKGHCGYRIMGHEDYHDNHHLLCCCNFGSMQISDYLLGTTAARTGTEKKKRL